MLEDDMDGERDEDECGEDGVDGSDIVHVYDRGSVTFFRVLI